MLLMTAVLMTNVVLNGSSIGTRSQAKLNYVEHRGQGRTEDQVTLSLSDHCSL